VRENLKENAKLFQNIVGNVFDRVKVEIKGRLKAHEIY
jgi:hypothetical protein